MTATLPERARGIWGSGDWRVDGRGGVRGRAEGLLLLATPPILSGGTWAAHALRDRWPRASESLCVASGPTLEVALVALQRALAALPRETP